MSNLQSEVREYVREFRRIKRRHARASWMPTERPAKVAKPETPKRPNPFQTSPRTPPAPRGRPKFEGVIPPEPGAKLPRGTAWNGHTYSAQVSGANGSTKYLGTFKTLAEADAAATTSRRGGRGWRDAR